jgi:hypothetical protein
VQLATIRELARYWQDYDSCKVEARLNALPQFMTNIDDVDIYFIYVRSKNLNTLPVIITHGDRLGETACEILPLPSWYLWSRPRSKIGLSGTVAHNF